MCATTIACPYRIERIEYTSGQRLLFSHQTYNCLHGSAAVINNDEITGGTHLLPINAVGNDQYNRPCGSS